MNLSKTKIMTQIDEETDSIWITKLQKSGIEMVLHGHRLGWEAYL